MSVVIFRMSMIVTRLPAIESKGKWDIESFRRNQATMQRLVKEHGLLTFEYAVLSTRLIQDITQLKSLHDSIPEDKLKPLQDQLKTVIRLSELLELLYDSYLNVPKKANALKKERAICLSYVTSAEDNSPKKDDLCSPLIGTSKVREVTAKLNWLRLFLVRTRRLLNSLIPLLRNWHINYHFLVHFDSFIAPIFNYLSWLFYIPRFLVNCGLLLKHLIPGRWMSDAEKQLGWSIRLQVQLERRWFELVNDLGWGIAGVLGCFILIGPLAAAGLYFGVAFFVFDVMTGAVRGLLDFRRYKRLAIEYAKLEVEYNKPKAEVKNSTADYLPELEIYHRYLQERISYEHKRMVLNFSVPIIILIAMSTALFSNPFIPFIGAIVLVSTTILAYLINRHLEKNKPLDSIKDNVKRWDKPFSNRFFSPAPTCQTPYIGPQTTLRPI